ncbi:hypothetical protein [Streptomyces sparsogenes]|uniref:hypothetical protein n=1 Tax=Streptomyces sparsogenes TaxID=67365 RepID=UPI0033E939D5
MNVQTTPHPRRSSAASRRHHRTYLPWRLESLAPGVTTIAVAPDTAGDAVHTLALHGTDGPITVSVEHGAHILNLLQLAFAADWTHTQTWQRGDNTLTDEDAGPLEVAKARTVASSNPRMFKLAFLAARHAGPGEDTEPYVRQLIAQGDHAAAAGYLEGLASRRADTPVLRACQMRAAA